MKKVLAISITIALVISCCACAAERIPEEGLLIQPIEEGGNPDSETNAGNTQANGSNGDATAASSPKTTAAAASPKATETAVASPNTTETATTTPEPTENAAATPKPATSPSPSPEPSATPVATPEPTTTQVATPTPAATPVATPKPTTTPAPTPEPTAQNESKSIIIDHNSVKLDQIPAVWVEKAVKDLHIAYGRTSHGSQIITGLYGLPGLKGGLYNFTGRKEAGAIDLRDCPFVDGVMDLGQPDNKAWADETRKYLKNNGDVNVVMWSWCGQLSDANAGYVENYLTLMEKLEDEFPNVTFVYMTGHLDGTGLQGRLHKNNELIRKYCIENDKVLYDFADIESYNPDGVYYLDKYANDNCDYDSDGDSKPDRNWAIEWQESHQEGVDWYQCRSTHSQAVNANMKAYAAWWMFARLAGWNGTPEAR